MKPAGKTIFELLCRAISALGGAAAVEFAITAPVLVVLVLGVADYGVLMGDAASLESAARAGAEFAKANPSVTAATLTSLGLFPTAATPTVTNICTCVDNTWPSGQGCPPELTANPCAGTPNPFIAGTDERVVQYIQVSVTQSFSPLFAVVNFPGLTPTTFGFPSSLSAQATIRIQ
jgi:Flp pilus assembly protein TadG